MCEQIVADADLLLRQQKAVVVMSNTSRAGCHAYRPRTEIGVPWLSEPETISTRLLLSGDSGENISG